MIRTQIQLTEEQSGRLKDLAERKNVSVAELIRRAVDNFLNNGDLLSQEAKHLSKEERWQRSLTVLGKFQSGVSDLSTNHDKYLAETYREW